MIEMEYPLTKQMLREQFGYLSFQCIFMNMDVITVKSLKTSRCVMITYCGAWKSGLICWDETLQWEKAFRIFQEAPSNYNDLERWERENSERIELFKPPKDDYVFIDDKLVRQVIKVREKK